MTKERRHALALLVMCPKCLSPHSTACQGKRGDRLTPHLVRYQLSKNLGFPKPRKASDQSGPFYQTDEWRAVRYIALRAAGGACQCCGVRASKVKPLHVDHIKPRSKFPELELEASNLQVLCIDCNLGKSNIDETDWRSA